MNPEGTDPLQTSLRERDEAVNEPLANSDNDHSDEDDNGGSESSSEEENENDYIYSGDRDESRDVILAIRSCEASHNTFGRNHNQKIRN